MNTSTHNHIDIYCTPPWLYLLISVGMCRFGFCGKSSWQGRNLTVDRKGGASADKTSGRRWRRLARVPACARLHLQGGSADLFQRQGHQGPSLILCI